MTKNRNQGMDHRRTSWQKSEHPSWTMSRLTWHPDSLLLNCLNPKHSISFFHLGRNQHETPTEGKIHLFVAYKHFALWNSQVIRLLAPRGEGALYSIQYRRLNLFSSYFNVSFCRPMIEERIHNTSQTPAFSRIFRGPKKARDKFRWTRERSEIL